VADAGRGDENERDDDGSCHSSHGFLPFFVADFGPDRPWARAIMRPACLAVKRFGLLWA
jgi:hypothetical protein